MVSKEQRFGLAPLYRRHLLLGTTGFVLLIAALAIVLRWNSNPSVVWLMDSDGAHWVGFPSEPQMVARVDSTDIVSYRVQFQVDSVPNLAALTFTAFETASVFVNRQLVTLVDPGTRENWKRAREIDIAALLRVGDNSIWITITNPHGPAMLKAAIPAVNVHSGSSWEASVDGLNWVPAHLASRVEPWPIGRDFPNAFRAWVKTLPFLFPVFLLMCVLMGTRSTHGPFARTQSFLATPSNVRIILIGAVLALGLNNSFKLGITYGFDWLHHLDYIHFILDHHRLPLANEALQGFQPPLFYWIASAQHYLLSFFFEHEAVDQTLHLIPIVAGAAQIEVAYRLSRLIFPERAGAQIVAIVFTSTLPMNLYMSQMIGNEPLFALIGSLCLYQAVRILVGRGPLKRADALGLGILLGLAFLTKATAILLLVPVTAALVIRALRGERPTRECARALATVGALTLTISAWFYLRNQLHFGQFFIGGWDPIIGMEWWHQPGYRTIHQYLRFGTGLFYPIYSMIPSFWDGLYASMWLDGHLGGIAAREQAPPWNYTLMLSGAWWGLIPMLAVLAGLMATLRSALVTSLNALVFRSPSILALVLCAVSSILFFAAVLAHTLVLPFYNACKASYALTAVCCLACLVAAGMDLVPRKALFRTTIHALFACWAVASYAAYFVI